MFLLVTYVVIALIISFLCSIAEAVLLSVTPAHIGLLKSDSSRVSELLSDLKDDIGKPLIAILTLNTVSHTAGAAISGAQAAAIFGNNYLGLFSAVLTLLILILSEIIPKTLGAHYWRQLTPIVTYGLTYMVKLLWPVILITERLTKGMTTGPTLTGFSRDEFSAMANISVQEGQLGQREHIILQNLLLLHKAHVRDAMTPISVVFSLSQDLRVDEFFHKYDYIRFSRIPIYNGDEREIVGFVLRSDLLLAQARGNVEQTLKNYSRDIEATLDYIMLSHAFEEFLRARNQIMLVVDEYGVTKGLLSLEDVLETLLGLEIVDEKDKNEDMQELARKLWRRRARDMGLDVD